MKDESISSTEAGFEYDGRFYSWHVSDLGKDLMLIDRLTGLSITEFFAIVDDDEQEGFRGPVLLALVATSLRHGHPDWSVERIVRVVLALHLSEINFVSTDDGDETQGVVPPPLVTLDVERSTSPPSDFSSSSIPPGSSNSETSSATPA